MARTITWDELRDLAGFEAEKGCAVSLYLDLDPRVTPTPADAATRLRSLLDEAAKGDGANRRDMTHDQRAGLKADFARIRDFYESQFTRKGARGGPLSVPGGSRPPGARAPRAGPGPGRGQGGADALPRAARPARRPGGGCSRR